jgi:hypothetical protein
VEKYFRGEYRNAEYNPKIPWHVNGVNLPYDPEHSLGVLAKPSENSAMLPRVPA